MNSQESPSDADDTDTEWRFSIDDVGPEAEAAAAEAAQPDPIEPEEISLEHATFVALGVLLMCCLR